MPLTQQQLVALLSGDPVNYGLPVDPGLNSANGVFFENVSFDTANGNQDTTPQGQSSLDVTDDIENFGQDNTSFVARNSDVSIGDDFAITFGSDSVFSFSGPNTVLNLLGQSGNSSRLRIGSDDGQTTSATGFISDGAEVTIENPDVDTSRGIQVGINYPGFIDNSQTARPAGQSADATLVIEGAGTQVSILNAAGGNRGALEIGMVFESDQAVPDVTENRTAEGLVLVRNGADVTVNQFIGIADTNGVDGATAQGALIVEGDGTRFTLGNEDGTSRAGFMRVGEQGGEGIFAVRDGAVFRILDGDEGSAGIHFSGADERAGGTATAVVIGEGTQLIVEGGFVEVGRNIGDASLLVSDGARLEARDFSTAQGGTAETIIEGEDTEVVLSAGDRGSLNVGRVNFEDQSINSADGQVTIRDGATVEVREFVGVGDAEGRANPDVKGTLIVEGANTTLTVGSEDRTGSNGFMRLGNDGASGTLIVRDGAQLTLFAGEEFMGGLQLAGSSDTEGGTGSATFTGAGTRLNAQEGSIIVGRNGGEASFTISDGAVVDATFFSVGQGGQGDAVVEGQGTQLNLSGEQVPNPEFGAFLTVGRGADGSFILRDGADVTITGDGGLFPGFQAGRNDGGTGVITITGAGTTLTIDGANNVEEDGGETGFIRAGNLDGSDGTINVLDGAVVTNEDTGLLIVAQNQGSIGRVTVDGAGSLLDFGAAAVLSEDAPAARGDAIVTVSNDATLRGDEVTNNGILDITSGGTLQADLVNDNVLRSSDGIEDTIIEGDLTVLTGGIDVEIAQNRRFVEHDSYTATGDVVLDGSLGLIGTTFSEFVGDEFEVITGASLTAQDSFTVTLIEFDAAAITQVDMPALIAAANERMEVTFRTTATSLFVVLGDDAVDGATSGQADVVEGSVAGDEIRSLGGSDNVDGRIGDDTLIGGAGNDTLTGGSGDDDIDGGIGADDLNGGTGNDTILGLNGFDVLNGGFGDDSLNSGFGNDSLNGDGGDDFLTSGLGFDSLDGGDGDDTLQALDGQDTLIGGDGNDSLLGGNGNDSLEGGAGDDTLDGGLSFDTMSGGEGDDLILGLNGFDVLNGDAGNDDLEGNAGNDTLNGGDGDDRMRGGLGADVFVYTGGNDVIRDYARVADSLQIAADLLIEANPEGRDLNNYDEVIDGKLVLDFGGGNTLTFNTLDTVNPLFNDVEFI